MENIFNSFYPNISDYLYFYLNDNLKWDLRNALITNANG
jgi:hypothetical protein